MKTLPTPEDMDRKELHEKIFECLVIESARLDTVREAYKEPINKVISVVFTELEREIEEMKFPEDIGCPSKDCGGCRHLGCNQALSDVLTLLRKNTIQTINPKE